jgi:arylsulfatase A
MSYFCAALLTMLALASSRAPRDKPNIAMLFVDDMGYGDTGFTGHPSASTPNLDKLAFHGKKLTTWYSAAAVCTASRTGLLTGRQPPRVGMPGVINSLSKEGLPLNETTIADYMKGAGYATLAIGKWHQGQQPQYLPLARGFDAFLGLPFSVDDGTGFVSKCGPGDSTKSPYNVGEIDRSGLGAGLGPQLPLPLIRQMTGTNASESEIVRQPTDLRLLTAEYLSFVQNFTRAHAAQPMFLYLAFSHVHTATPNIEPDPPVPSDNGAQFEQYSGCKFVGATRRGRFGDALAEVDWMVGGLVQELRDLGIEKNTLILFTSDNGPWLMKGASGGSAGLFTGRLALSWERAGDQHQGDIHNKTPLVNYGNTGKGSTWEGGR